MNHALHWYGVSLSACGLLIQFKPPPTFTQARVHLQAHQGRSCVHCSCCGVSGRHVLAYFLFLLAAPLRHALPIKHVNVFLNKGHRPTCACSIKWESCLNVMSDEIVPSLVSHFSNMQLRIVNVSFIALPNCQKQLNRQFTNCQFNL